MTKEKGYTNHCFIKRTDGKAFCSKCGAIIAQDTYNMKKHAEQCGFGENDFVKIYRENKDFTCAWRGEGDRMFLEVYTPILKTRPGFNDRYEGGMWAMVYQCEFGIKEKYIREARGGLQNLEFWKTQNMDSLNGSNSYEFAYKYFHIPGYKNLRSFINIYQGKGYPYNPRLTDEQARMILRKKEKSTSEFNQQLWKANRNETYISGQLEYVPNVDEPLLRLDIHTSFSTRCFKILIAKDYFFTDDKIDVRKLLQENFYTVVDEKDLEKFDRCYPQFGLMNYWKMSQVNILIPLLSANFDSRMELLSKAGCAVAADSFYLYKPFEADNPEYENCTDIKSWLGIPAKILRRVRHDCFRTNYVLSILAEVYKYAPEHLEVERITYKVIRHLEGNVLPAVKGRGTDIDGFQEFDKKIQLRITRYIAEDFGHPNGGRADYSSYVDYMNMSRICDCFVGYTPRNLVEAHDVAMINYRNRLSQVKAEDFVKKVSEDRYVSLESNYDDQASFFEEDSFIIKAPKSINEMYRESEKLHHCVRTYNGRVVMGRSKIFFLRKKEEPEEPYGTIEVQGQRVFQLKGLCNSKVSLEAQNFVRKWAKVKGLTIDSTDFN